MKLLFLIQEKLKNPSWIIITVTIGVFASLMVSTNISSSDSGQHFSYLAQSFLDGHTYFTQDLKSWNDTTLFNGRHYWTFSLFPSILLLPFVAIFDQLGILFTQGYLNLILASAIFALWVKISQKIGFSIVDSLYLAFAFAAGSVFLDVALISYSSYFAQVVTVFFFVFLFMNF